MLSAGPALNADAEIAALMDAYGARAPRDTSYPTVLRFRGDVPRERLQAVWAEDSPDAAVLSLYIHIPFCRRRCAYCGCYAETGFTPEGGRAYAEAVLREARRARHLLFGRRRLVQLSVGGGTPTFLAPDTMASLVRGVIGIFPAGSRAEIAIELDPSAVDEAYLDVLADLGFSRFGFGVQDLDAGVLAAVGREAMEGKTSELIAHLRCHGRPAVTIDLMYGLPGQTPSSFRRTLEKTAAWKPGRIALFEYAHLPNRFPHQARLEALGLPACQERWALFSLAREVLQAAGYIAVGVDHFALPGDDLAQALRQRRLTRNFMGYAVRHSADWVGLGASAVSAVGSCYVQNAKSAENYIMGDPKALWAKACLLTPEDRLRREVIQELLCYFSLDIAGVEAAFGIDFQRHFRGEWETLGRFEQDGLLVRTPSALRVTERGRFFVRHLGQVFDRAYRWGEGGVRNEYVAS